MDVSENPIVFARKLRFAKKCSEKVSKLLGVGFSLNASFFRSGKFTLTSARYRDTFHLTLHFRMRNCYTGDFWVLPLLINQR